MLFFSLDVFNNTCSYIHIKYTYDDKVYLYIYIYICTYTSSAVEVHHPPPTQLPLKSCLPKRPIISWCICSSKLLKGVGSLTKPAIEIRETQPTPLLYDWIKINQIEIHPNQPKFKSKSKIHPKLKSTNLNNYNQQNLAKGRACAHHKAIKLEFQYIIYFSRWFFSSICFLFQQKLTAWKTSPRYKTSP